MIEHYSSRIQNIIQKELFKAKESIQIAVAWFTNDLLFQPLLLKLATGVKVELILNADEINKGQDNEVDFEAFQNAGGTLIWNESKQLMHEKFCIIDHSVVIFGSYNWTNKAEYNDESIAIARNEASTVKFYSDHFEKICSKYSSKTSKNESQEVVSQGRNISKGNNSNAQQISPIIKQESHIEHVDTSHLNPFQIEELKKMARKDHEGAIGLHSFNEDWPVPSVDTCFSRLVRQTKYDADIYIIDKENYYRSNLVVQDIVLGKTPTRYASGHIISLEIKEEHPLFWALKCYEYNTGIIHFVPLSDLLRSPVLEFNLPNSAIVDLNYYSGPMAYVHYRRYVEHRRPNKLLEGISKSQYKIIDESNEYFKDYEKIENYIDISTLTEFESKISEGKSCKIGMQSSMDIILSKTVNLGTFSEYIRNILNISALENTSKNNPYINELKQKIKGKRFNIETKWVRFNLYSHNKKVHSRKVYVSDLDYIYIDVPANEEKWREYVVSDLV